MNEEGDPGLTEYGNYDDGALEYPEDSGGLVAPRTYGLLVLGGIVLLVFPEPFTSVLGVALILTGAFLGLVDLLTA